MYEVSFHTECAVVFVRILFLQIYASLTNANFCHVTDIYIHLSKSTSLISPQCSIEGLRRHSIFYTIEEFISKMC